MGNIKVLFVCMGNICRSPTAEGIFSNLVTENSLQSKIHIDSAGTHAYHVGSPPDPRSQSCVARKGIDISQLRARKVSQADFQKYDWIIPMDHDNYNELLTICPSGMESKIKLFLDFAPHLDEKDVPDPYYGGANGFEHVVDLIEHASLGLLSEIKTQLK